MLAELAARLVFSPLSAAPPHFAAPLGLMYATRPVEIFLFVKLLLTIFANFDVMIYFALLRHNFLQIFSKFFAVFLSSFFLFFQSLAKSLKLLKFLRHKCDAFVLPTQFVLRSLHLDTELSFQACFLRVQKHDFF